MTYAETLEEKIKKYCAVKNIPVIRGQVSEIHKKEIYAFIIKEIRCGRKSYARGNSSNINPAIKTVLGEIGRMPKKGI